MANIHSLEDLIGMLRRRWPVMAPVLILGATLAVMTALSQPRLYESAAVIQVERPGVAITSAQPLSAQQVQAIEQRLMTRNNLLALKDRYGLFTDLLGFSQTEKVVLLRRSIRFQSVTADATAFGTANALSALLIVVQLDDPLTAADIANDLANQVIDLTSRTQAERLREALDFYIREEKEIARDLTQLESEITSFQNRNIDALPAGRQSRRDELLRIEEEIRALDRALLEAQSTRAGLGAASGRTVVQRQIDTVDREVATLETERALLTDRRSVIEEAIRRSPQIETMLGAFDRRLQQMQEQYSTVLRRRAEAETTKRMEADRQTERFELLEPALPPDYALSSGRRKALVLGLAASIAAALALALALELRNPVLRTAAQMHRALDLQPVIAIPQIPAAGAGASGMRRIGLGAMTGIFALVAMYIFGVILGLF